MAKRSAAVAAVDGPDDADLGPGADEDAFDQIGGRGLAVGAGNGDDGHLLRRVAIEGGGQFGQGAAGIGDGDDGRAAGHGPFHDHGGRSALDRRVDEVVAVGLQAFHCDEDPAGPDLLSTVMQRGHLRPFARNSGYGGRRSVRDETSQFHPRSLLSMDTLSFSVAVRGGTFR